MISKVELGPPRVRADGLETEGHPHSAFLDAKNRCLKRPFAGYEGSEAGYSLPATRPLSRQTFLF